MWCKLDVSWRKGEPIDVLVNPWKNAPREIEALCGDRPGRRSIRFQLNTIGVIWFADSHVAMHGDESRGRIIPSSVSTGFSDRDLFGSPCLVYGGIEFPSWRVEASCPNHDLVSISSPAKILNEFTTWRRATDGVDVDLVGLPKPVWTVSAVFDDGSEHTYVAGVPKKHDPRTWSINPDVPRIMHHDIALQLAAEQPRWSGFVVLVETVKERAARRGANG